MIFEALVILSRLLPKSMMSSSYGDLKETKICKEQCFQRNSI